MEVGSVGKYGSGKWAVGSGNGNGKWDQWEDVAGDMGSGIIEDIWGERDQWGVLEEEMGTGDVR